MSGDILLALGQRLDEITLTCVPAGKPVSIVLADEESAPHNVSTERVTNAVPALAAGTYTFQCEVHPDMLGWLVMRRHSTRRATGRVCGPASPQAAQASLPLTMSLGVVPGTTNERGHALHPRASRSGASVATLTHDDRVHPE